MICDIRMQTTLFCASVHLYFSASFIIIYSISLMMGMLDSSIVSKLISAGLSVYLWYNWHATHEERRWKDLKGIGFSGEVGNMKMSKMGVFGWAECLRVRAVKPLSQVRWICDVKGFDTTLSNRYRFVFGTYPEHTRYHRGRCCHTIENSERSDISLSSVLEENRLHT